MKAQVAVWVVATSSRALQTQGRAGAGAVCGAVAGDVEVTTVRVQRGAVTQQVGAAALACAKPHRYRSRGASCACSSRRATGSKPVRHYSVDPARMRCLRQASGRRRRTRQRSQTEADLARHKPCAAGGDGAARVRPVGDRGRVAQAQERQATEALAWRASTSPHAGRAPYAARSPSASSTKGPRRWCSRRRSCWSCRRLANWRPKPPFRKQLALVQLATRRACGSRLGRADCGDRVAVMTPSTRHAHLPREDAGAQRRPSPESRCLHARGDPAAARTGVLVVPPDASVTRKAAPVLVVRDGGRPPCRSRLASPPRRRRSPEWHREGTRCWSARRRVRSRGMAVTVVPQPPMRPRRSGA